MGEVVYDNVSENQGHVGEGNHAVEIDDAKFGKRKYNLRRRVVVGRWVFGGIDRTTRLTFLIPIESGYKNTLFQIIKRK